MVLGARSRERLKERIGVSRVARVTGLDRAGVEVACAVRPGGHILQVSNGKGGSWAEAEAGALLEAAELWGAETVDPTQLVWGSAGELRARRSDEVWGADEAGSAGAPLAGWSESLRLAWRVGVELATGRRVLVPAQAIHCPPAGAPALGPAVVRWTTNGMGAHPDREAAVRHALLEAVERDQLARALPDGWTAAAVVERMLSPGSLSGGAPRTAALAQKLAKDFEVYLFDLSPRPGMGLPVGGALLFDRWRGPVPLTAGYACATDADSALRGALLEAAQSRLTDIHGARDDVAHEAGAEIEALRALCNSVGGSNDAG